MTRSSSIVALAVSAITLSASPAAAQWQAFPPATTINQDGVEFWDNVSADAVGGAICNIGAVFAGTAQSAQCNNERPDPWLPYSGVEMDEFYAANTGFSLFNVDPTTVQFTLYGDIAGNNGGWGIYDGANSLNRVNLNVLFAGPTVPEVLLGNDLGLAPNEWASFGFWIQTSNGFDLQTSGTQHAFFRTSTGDVVGVGMEDTFVNGDRDYNDVVVTMLFDSRAQVPEPSSVLLALSGMVVLAGAAIRRRT